MSCIACLTSLTHLDLSHTDVDGSGLEQFCSALQVRNRNVPPLL